ncbi:MAG: hypothetical protein RMJ39_10215 [Deltaproteobacteria bacterium]|nr:hypothetical protein [Deltaproteobacteria bacterium]
MIAGDLNNQTLSLIDLGRKEEAESLLRKALELDPTNPEAVYNLLLLEWRDRRIDDLTAVRRFKEIVIKNHPGKWLPVYLLAKLHLERGDKKEALELLKPYRGVSSEVDELFVKAEKIEGMRCIRTFVGDERSVYSVALTSDGRYALSGSGDSTLKL